MEFFNKSMIIANKETTSNRYLYEIIHRLG
jgi:hypothetical protein